MLLCANEHWQPSFMSQLQALCAHPKPSQRQRLEVTTDGMAQRGQTCPEPQTESEAQTLNQSHLRRQQCVNRRNMERASSGFRHGGKAEPL